MFPLPFKNFVRRDARDPRARVRQARAEEEAKVFNGVVRALNALSCGLLAAAKARRARNEHCPAG